MFKFLKELKESFQEGVNEAKQELAEEKENESQQAEQILTEISQLPNEEIFGSSLAAPFRAAALNDWFTLFKSTKESLEESVIPMHLYTFGDLETLEKADVEALREQQKLSFDVNNEEEVLETGKNFLMSIGINLASLSDESLQENWVEAAESQTNKQASSWTLSAFASLLISGVEFNDVSKKKALEIFKELVPYVLEKYNNWNEFAKDFLLQDEMLNINTGKQLKNTVSYLTYKYGSPWVQYPLENYQDSLANE